jgi:hypothetical protein
VDTQKKEIKFVGGHPEDRDIVYRWTPCRKRQNLYVDTLKKEIKFIGGHPEDRDKVYRWTP